MFRKEFLTVSLSSAQTKEDQRRHEFYFVGLENIFTISRSTVSSKIEKVPRGIRGEKSSKDMASSRNDHLED